MQPLREGPALGVRPCRRNKGLERGCAGPAQPLDGPAAPPELEPTYPHHRALPDLRRAIADGTNSWLYVPLLHAAAADLAPSALQASQADPRSADWWELARQHLAASTPVSPHLFCCGARLRCAETTPAQAHHLPNLAARIHDAGLPSGSLVHVGWAVRQLREPDWKALPHDGWRFETLNFWIRFNSTIFGFTLLALRIPSSLFCFRFFSGVFP